MLQNSGLYKQRENMGYYLVSLKLITEVDFSFLQLHKESTTLDEKTLRKKLNTQNDIR